MSRGVTWYDVMSGYLLSDFSESVVPGKERAALRGVVFVQMSRDYSEYVMAWLGQ